MIGSGREIGDNRSMEVTKNIIHLNCFNHNLQCSTEQDMGAASDHQNDLDTKENNLLNTKEDLPENIETKTLTLYTKPEKC